MLIDHYYLTAKYSAGDGTLEVTVRREIGKEMVVSTIPASASLRRRKKKTGK